MDLTKWLPLWEKCPELRPEALSWDGLDWFVDPPGLYVGEEARATEHLGAALIRDRAVWWLNGTVEGRNRLMLALNDAQLGYDPTEALYLACAKVLGAEP